MPDSPTPPFPTLPTEVVLQIFQEACYSNADLASLALVSRRFLSTVQTTLYESYCLKSYQLLPDRALPANEQDQTPRDLYYEEQSWLFLQTLDANPRLATLIRCLDLGHSRPYFFKNLIPATSTSPAPFIRDLLELATNLDSLVIQEGLLEVASRDVWSVLREHGSKVKKLWVWAELERQDIVKIGQVFPSVTDLTMKGFTTRSRSFPVLHHLETLSVVGKQKGEVPLPFIGTSLRNLRINIETAAELDYSRCPGLTRLDISYLAGFDDSPFDFRPTGDFWRRLQDSPNLDTLSIIGPQTFDHMGTPYDHGQRGDWNYLCTGLFRDVIQAGITVHQPKLRKMVFEGGIFIE